MKEAEKFAQGDYIAGGGTRECYASAVWPDRVVKVAFNDEGIDGNREEFRVWKRASKTLRKFLAETYCISRDGTRLIMQRTERCTIAEHLNAKFPSWLSGDTHSGNTGKLPDGRVVMHDYGFHSLGDRKRYVAGKLERVHFG